MVCIRSPFSGFIFCVFFFGVCPCGLSSVLIPFLSGRWTWFSSFRGIDPQLTLVEMPVTHATETSSESYDVAYNKVLQWRKNWYALYIEVAEEILRNLVNTNGYLKALPTEKPYVDLKSAHSRFYSWTQINQLFQAIHVGTYLWKDTLDKPNSKALYKTLFTYTMV
jgi:hypothetical protein